jgi:hypothetical protein
MAKFKPPTAEELRVIDAKVVRWDGTWTERELSILRWCIAEALDQKRKR